MTSALAISCLLVLLQAPGSGGDGLDAAAAHAERGDYAAALEILQSSYAEKPRPFLLYNIGQLHRASGDCARALEAYEKFLATAEPQDPDRERAERKVTEVRACLEARPPAAVAPESGSSKPPVVVAAAPSVPTQGTAAPPPATPLLPVVPSAQAIEVTSAAPHGRGSKVARLSGWGLVALATVAAGAGAYFAIDGWLMRRDLDRDSRSGGAWNDARQTQQDGVDKAAQRAFIAGTSALLAGGTGAALIYFNPAAAPASAKGPPVPGRRIGFTLQLRF